MENSHKDMICSYCEGKLSAEEELELLQWVRKSDENKETFRETEREWRRDNTPSMTARMAVAKARNKAHHAAVQHRVIAQFAGIAAVAAVAAAFLFSGKGESPVVHLSDSAQAFSVSVPMSSTTEVSLPDGTKVILNAGSELHYDRNFNKKNRDIFLKGEGYFDVVKDENLPFIVHTQDCKITVLGTRFDVYAYEGEGVTYAALLEGSLRFDAGTSSMLISPDEVATFDGMSIIKSITETDQYISWINGAITYDEIGLSEFLHRVSRLYDINIAYGKSNLDSRKFRAAFSQKDSVDNILDAISNLLPINVEKSGEGYIVTEN